MKAFGCKYNGCYANGVNLIKGVYYCQKHTKYMIENKPESNEEPKCSNQESIEHKNKQLSDRIIELEKDNIKLKSFKVDNLKVFAELFDTFNNEFKFTLSLQENIRKEKYSF